MSATRAILLENDDGNPWTVVVLLQALQIAFTDGETFTLPAELLRVCSLAADSLKHKQVCWYKSLIIANSPTSFSDQLCSVVTIMLV